MEEAPINHSTQSTASGIPPPPVALAVKLAIIGLVVGSATQLFMIFVGDMPRSKIASMLTVIITFAFMLWIYRSLYAGKNWARYVVLILSVLGWFVLLSPTVRAQMQNVTPLGKIAAVANTFLNLYLLWAAFISSGKAWFKKSSSAHAA